MPVKLTRIFGPEVAQEIEKRLAVLSPRELEVFLARRGFDRNGNPPSYRAISMFTLYPKVTPARIQQIYAKATRKLVANSASNLVLQLPIFSCECGKYAGVRFLDVRCDKCGKEVTCKGELQTLLVTETWKEGKKVSVSVLKRRGVGD